MTKNGKPKNDDEEQSKRFIETAKKLATEKDGKAFEKAVNSVVKNKGETKNQAD